MKNKSKTDQKNNWIFKLLNLRHKSWWGSWLLLLIVLAIYFVFGAWFATAFGVILGTVYLDIFLAAFSLWFLANRKYNLFNESKRKIASKKQLFWLIGISILVFLLIFYLGQTFGTAIYMHGDSNFARYAKASKTTLINTIAMSVFFAPISEELLYRGFIYNLFRAKYSILTSCLVQAAIFSLMHGTLVHIPGTFSLAIFNVILLEYTGKFRYNILSHMMYNILTFLSLNIKVPNLLLRLPVISFLYLLLIAGLIMMLMYTTMQKKQKQHAVSAQFWDVL